MYAPLDEMGLESSTARVAAGARSILSLFIGCGALAGHYRPMSAALYVLISKQSDIVAMRLTLSDELCLDTVLLPAVTRCDWIVSPLG